MELGEVEYDWKIRERQKVEIKAWYAPKLGFVFKAIVVSKQLAFPSPKLDTN